MDLDLQSRTIQSQSQIDLKAGKLSQGYFFKNNRDICFGNAKNIFVIKNGGQSITHI